MLKWDSKLHYIPLLLLIVKEGTINTFSAGENTNVPPKSVKKIAIFTGLLTLTLFKVSFVHTSDYKTLSVCPYIYIGYNMATLPSEDEQNWYHYMNTHAFLYNQHNFKA